MLISEGVGSKQRYEMVLGAKYGPLIVKNIDFCGLTIEQRRLVISIAYKTLWSDVCLVEGNITAYSALADNFVFSITVLQFCLLLGINSQIESREVCWRLLEAMRLCIRCNF